MSPLVLLTLLLAGSPAAEAPKVVDPPVANRPFQMEHYLMAFLRRGPKYTTEDTAEVRAVQEGHMANINRMAQLGKLILAGPFADDGDLRGLFLFQGVTREEAEKLVAEDPAIKTGRLVVEWHPWFAAKGICVIQNEQDLAKAAQAAGLPLANTTPTHP